jgi:DNA adenine methylase
VPRLHINDLDPAIFAFWISVTEHSADFLALFDQVELTLEEWHRQREVYRVADLSDPVALGYATFFLNRTNRSGVMNAGVIGGQLQNGRYRIDARFNRAQLRQKLEWIGREADRIEVTNRDGLAVLAESMSDPGMFSYIDPPYYDKGSFLYLNSLAEDSHRSLAALLKESRDKLWVLTYDDVPAIRELYRGLHQGTFALPYSAHRATVATERMVLSDAVAALDGVMP